MVPAVSRQARQPRRTAVLLALILAAAVTGEGRLPRFEAVSEPAWRPESPPLPEALVPRAEHPEAASWACLGEAPDTRDAAEHDLLVRLSVVLETSRTVRSRLLQDRAAALAAADSLLAPAASALARELDDLPELAGTWRRPSWLPLLLDPASGAVEKHERIAAARWASTLPTGASCGDPVALGGHALELAVLVLRNDAGFALTRSQLTVLAREARALTAAPLAAGDARLADATDGIEESLAVLDETERTWREPFGRIATLVAEISSRHGLEAAALASRLRTLRQTLAEAGDPAAAAAAVLVGRAAGRAAAVASRADPRLIVERPTMLDLRYADEDSPRHAAVAHLTASLADQLPALEQLHAVRVERSRAFASASPAQVDPQLEALDREAQELWFRLASAARRLGDPDLPDWRRGWAWTQVGAARDRLLPLEEALAGLQERALWADPSPEHHAAVRRQQRVTAVIESARGAEAAPLVRLQRHAEDMLGSAAAAVEALAELVAAARRSSGEGEGHELLTVAEATLRARAAALVSGAAAVDEVRAALPSGLETSAASFLQTSLALDPVPELERLLAARSQAERALRELGGSPPAADRRAAILAVAALLDVPPEVTFAHDAVTLTFRGGGAALSVPVATAATTKARLDGTDDHPPSRAVLSWIGPPSSAPLRWHAAAANTPTTPDDDFFLETRRMPQSWEEGQRWARDNPKLNAASHLGAEMGNNLGSYLVAGAVGLTGACLAAASAPAIAAAGTGMVAVAATMAAAEVLKDAATATARSLNTAYGSVDPRDRASLDGWITTARLGADLVTGALSVGNAKSGIEALVGLTGNVTAGWSSVPVPPSDPHILKAAEADQKIEAAAAAARACEWLRARQLIQEAWNLDPLKLGDRWTSSGNEVTRLVQGWERYGVNSVEALAAARQRATDEVYGCGPAAGSLPEHLLDSYHDEARWACDAEFEREMARYMLLGEKLEEIRAALGDAQASCSPGEAEGLARQVVDWADTVGRPFACAGVLRFSAGQVLEWATELADDPMARLSRIREAITACRLAEARELLHAPGPPDRCADAGLTAAMDEIRTSLWNELEARERDGGRLETLAQEAAAAQAACDRERLSALLAELEGLQLCVEGGESRRAALAGQLRQSLELSAGRSLELLGEARDAFNEAIRLADTACDMAPARAALERASSLLDGLSTSPCAQLLGGEVAELDHHGSYVRRQVEDREAALARIRASYSAGDAAFSTALATCSRAGLLEAAALLGEVVAGIDGLPVLADPSCAAIVELSVEATALKDEASTLIGYWDGVAGDLDSARLAAAEGRQIATETFCAGVRQKAQPASCFAAELADCAGLVPATAPPATHSDAVVAAPPPSSPAATGGGSARVQVDDPEPCARDVHWVPARQRFECTCPGYTFDDVLERCVAGGAAVAVSQATCDAQYPGTRLGSDPETGQPACLCPAGSAWSGTHGRCLELAASVSGPAARMGCDPSSGRFYDPATGRCDCLVGRWDERLGRCVDTAAADRQRNVDDQRQTAECERLYSDIQVFRRNPDAIFQAHAAAAETRARQLGCDSGRIADARARGSRPVAPAPTTTATGAGQVAAGTATTPVEAGVGTCHIQEYPGQGEVTVVFEQQAEGAHVNVYVVPANEEDLENLIAHMAGLPGYRQVGTYASPATAANVARELCRGREMH